MEAGILLTFSIALAATFVGGLPFGAINLSVVNITLNKSFGKAMEFALAASLVEIGQAFLAIFFGMQIEHFLTEYAWIQLIIAAAFIGLGIYNLVRVTHPKLGEKTKLKAGEFLKGMVIALVNIQAVPFWIFVLAALSPHVNFNFSGTTLVLFLVGVFVGKYLSLVLFGFASRFLENRLKKSCTLINRSLGAILLIIGLLQAGKYLTTVW